MSYFVSDYVDRGSVMWVQGSASDRACLLVSGRLQHLLEDEANTVEVVYPGHLVGEYGLLNQQIRSGMQHVSGARTFTILGSFTLFVLVSCIVIYLMGIYV